jgi:phosphoadenosine phosphosulfate reductase
MRLLESPEKASIASLDLHELEAAAKNGTLLTVRLQGETNFAVLLKWQDRLANVIIMFPSFRDGRGFSFASVLRARGFRGNLIAGGDLLPDQAIMLARCGFDAVELPPRASREEWNRALKTFSTAYQPAARSGQTVWEARQARAKYQASDLVERIRSLEAAFRGAATEVILQALIRHEFAGRIAILSSFGAEAAVSLHLVASIDPKTPVLFLDTDRHFAPTLQYRDLLVEHLGLQDVRILQPAAADSIDERGDLWATDPDLCCNIRKVLPLGAVASQFDALITGRKRMHGGERLRLPTFELRDEQIRVNPLVNWSSEQIGAYFERHRLPHHPLIERGFTSIGCWPCTRPSHAQVGDRSGRWAGFAKRECGIHQRSKMPLTDIGSPAGR